MSPLTSYTEPELRIISIQSEYGYVASSLILVQPAEVNDEPERTPQGNESSAYTHKDWEW